MKKVYKGFSLLETILYLGIFSVMATALLQLSWDILDLGAKDRVSRRVFSDARFMTERINFFIRNAEGIDTGSSSLGDGKLVLTQPGTSDTVTLEVQNEQLVLTETGNASVVMTGSDARIQSLVFLESGSDTDGSHYVGYTIIVGSKRYDQDVRASYKMTTTLQSGALIRNAQTGL